jgi:hypothetical protein
MWVVAKEKSLVAGKPEMLEEILENYLGYNRPERPTANSPGQRPG